MATHHADILTAVEPEHTNCSSTADCLPAVQPESSMSTHPADSMAAIDAEPTDPAIVADCLAALEPRLSVTCAADSSVLVESHDSGPASHIGLDYVVDLPLYKESTSEEEIFDSATSDEESSFTPDVEEGLPATQGAEDIFHASARAEPINHSLNLLRESGYLRATEIPRIPFLLFIWLISSLLSIITWMKIQIQQAWHEENGQGAPTKKRVGPVAAAPDP
eukprot:XP_008757649.1 PREDICTED: uncharacterized protein LOC100911353 [Rattus norvegicus]